MSELLEFIKSHEEAFRSRARLASLYSDFRFQRSSNPDGYQANSSAWLRALSKAASAGLIPRQNQASGQYDHFALHTGEELLRALETREFGRPLALGAAVEDAVKGKELVPLRRFLDAKESIYAGGGWLPRPWQVVSWGLRQLGVIGREGSGEDRLVAGDFVVMANVEAASKAILEKASALTSSSNTSRIFTTSLLASTFASALDLPPLTQTDLSILLTHLSRDKSAITYSPSAGVLKFKSPSEATPQPLTNEDISIANLRSLIATLSPQIETLTTRVAELDTAARTAVAAKQTQAAKHALRSKKLAETTLAQRSAALAQLEEVYASIEQAADQVELIAVLESAGKTLKVLNERTGGVDKVQDVVDGLREERANVEEIGAVLNEGNAGAVDEGEVEDEFEALEREEREKRRKAEEERERRVAEEEVERTRKRLEELDDVAPTKAETQNDKMEGQDTVKDASGEPAAAPVAETA
ncbi:Snf7-domain-containing protein [Neohortaea acidophila]|uniref:Snf7-domain-containing protein n=1 Tax=Neohortaea acidophila TaxID=245834 RepID=A0A6A6Q7X1_9PEZI|nr:Snf7-domain-containing protein [Neohortaea acidophila]KAF2488149.1 Snf7-domain-containing protein [Neohortaea acidophila]